MARKHRKYDRNALPPVLAPEEPPHRPHTRRADRPWRIEYRLKPGIEPHKVGVWATDSADWTLLPWARYETPERRDQALVTLDHKSRHDIFHARYEYRAKNPTE